MWSLAKTKQNKTKAKQTKETRHVHCGYFLIALSLCTCRLTSLGYILRHGIVSFNHKGRLVLGLSCSCFWFCQFLPTVCECPFSQILAWISFSGTSSLFWASWTWVWISVPLWTKGPFRRRYPYILSPGSRHAKLKQGDLSMNGEAWQQVNCWTDCFVRDKPACFRNSGGGSEVIWLWEFTEMIFEVED